MIRPSMTLRSLLPAALTLLSLAAPLPVLAADNRACKLLTPGELEPVVGGKLSAFQGMDAGSGKGPVHAEICSAAAPNASVMLRLAKRASGGGSATAASQGLEIARKMGATVDLKTFGPITCSTIIPPKSMEQYGFNTTCSVVKTGEVAAVEVQAKSQKDMVSIEKLRPLAEKMSARF